MCIPLAAVNGSLLRAAFQQWPLLSSHFSTSMPIQSTVFPHLYLTISYSKLTDHPEQIEELELTKIKATDLLKAHDGDATKALRAFITAAWYTWIRLPKLVVYIIWHSNGVWTLSKCKLFILADGKAGCKLVVLKWRENLQISSLLPIAVLVVIVTVTLTLQRLHNLRSYEGLCHSLSSSVLLYPLLHSQQRCGSGT